MATVAASPAMADARSTEGSNRVIIPKRVAGPGSNFSVRLRPSRPMIG